MMAARRTGPSPPRRKGSVAVAFAILMPAMVGFMGLAIDLTILYSRNVDLQHLADATAVAAAHELNGTLAGVTNAKTKATDIARVNSYDFSRTTFSPDESWSTDALFFSSAPSGAQWKRADSISDEASAAALMYAKVDTSELGALSMNPGLVATSFMRALGAPAGITAVPVAVAGRIAMQVTPLAVCALNTTKLGSRTAGTNTELVELGYRRGVTYDLLQLNPSGSTAQNFLVNPVDPGSAASQGVHFGDAWIKPFICTGTIGFANLRQNASVHIQALAGRPVQQWLNSRFGDYASDGCPSRDAAPPDKNVREFLAATTSDWMNPAAAGPSAASNVRTADTALLTSADGIAVPLNMRDPIINTSFGPLWAYNRPVRYVASSPTGAGTQFTTGNWAALYPVTSGIPPAATTSISPYQAQTQSPSAGVYYAGRRILNLPLLDCSAGTLGASGTVLGIGRFFMTSRATATAIYGEFAGLVNDENLATLVALHQ